MYYTTQGLHFAGLLAPLQLPPARSAARSPAFCRRLTLARPLPPHQAPLARALAPNILLLTRRSLARPLGYSMRSPARSMLAFPLANSLPRSLASERQKTLAIGARERGTIPACTGPFMDKPLRVAKNTNTVRHYCATLWNSDLPHPHSH